MVNSWSFGAPNGANAVKSFPGLTDAQKAALLAKYQYIDVAPGTDFESVLNADRNGYQFAKADVNYFAGQQAKGPNGNPAAVFSDHGFVQYIGGGNTYWFDPSYGHVYWGNTDDQRLLYLDDNSMSGYSIGIKANIYKSYLYPGWTGDSNATELRYVLLIRQNPVGTLDLKKS